MADASSPWVDTWAPSQYVVGGTGGAGPVRSPDTSGIQIGLAMNTPSTFDGTLHIKLAGTILAALIGIFVLQAMGFRFVVAAGG